MAYDVLIKNGSIVDGTGAPARHGDVALQDGKVVALGKVEGSAKQTIDASDCVVAPGFVDPHTHYDAQICWDGAVTPSSWHGVTSVVMGNCGVGIAPCLPEAREIAMRDLVNVEAIPYDVLAEGITWDWETFPQYMAAAEQRKPSVNLGFLAPLTPFRHYVMGEESMERAANADETARIAALIDEAMDAGAFGFSSTVLNQHLGFQGRPLACRNASTDELKAYANVLKRKNKNDSWGGKWLCGDDTYTGVDLNRNYGFSHGNQGSKEDPCGESFSGPFPFSEPETRAMRDFIFKHVNEIKFVYNFHSYGNMYVTPFNAIAGDIL